MNQPVNQDRLAELQAILAQFPDVAVRTTGGLVSLTRAPGGSEHPVVRLPEQPEWSNIGTPVLVVQLHTETAP